uniref:Uncharacterized protein n=1 Tax=Physcomitrium patens TaxID=3218 RepID=A0A2K1JSY9_PHYPA|nr:hypothetical protein PHYPA_014416 [Physcomitrium patens]
MREGDSIIKHIHTFRVYMEQLRQLGITLASLITNLIQEDIFMKNMSLTSDNNSTLYVKRHCNVNIKLINGDKKIIPDALHRPRLAKNLFFAKKLYKGRGEICIRASTTTLKNKFGQTIVICKLNPDLYELGTTILLNKPQIAILTTI